ncbi:MAG: Rho termination factor N-terminal domain-containing protein, partial [Ferruginibacter sp.]
MYDILQLNDMLVPELQDIAIQQNISNSKKLDKQELIYRILDKQAVMSSPEVSSSEGEKPKRKRIIKSPAEPAELALQDVPKVDIIEDKTKIE